jgi:hypothetical protein
VGGTCGTQKSQRDSVFFVLRSQTKPLDGKCRRVGHFRTDKTRVAHECVELPTKHHPPLRILLLVRRNPFHQLCQSNKLLINRD